MKILLKFALLLSVLTVLLVSNAIFLSSNIIVLLISIGLFGVGCHVLIIGRITRTCRNLSEISMGGNDPPVEEGDEIDEINRAFDRTMASMKLITTSSDTPQKAAAAETLRTFLDQVKDTILILDPNGVIKFINHPAPGYRVEEVTGTNILDYLPKDKQKDLKTGFKNALETGEAQTYIFSGNLPDGKESTLETKLIPLRDGGLVEAVISYTREVAGKGAPRYPPVSVLFNKKGASGKD